ncbi:recombinase family protein, partial [Woodsholea maritima]
MRIGYARVSTHDQSLNLQRDALVAAQCDQVFEDHGISGACLDRPAYNQMMKALNAGDELVVWRLDRLARSVFDLIDTLHTMKARGIVFRSICEGMDTGSPFGETVFVVASA